MSNGGLATRRRCKAVANLPVRARGRAYGPGSGAERWDQQSTYLKHIFGFIDFTDIQEIFIEPTEANPTSKIEALAVARQKAEKVAAYL
jgi:FMN-dependent NADH-azoreductase